MAKLYKQHMLEILDKLGITAPAHIEMDQMQIELLLGKVKTALDTYDPLPTGNATAADVALGKTFSNATGTGKVGTYVVPEPAALPVLPTPIVSIDGAGLISVVGAPLLSSLFTAVNILDGAGEIIGVATIDPDPYFPAYTFDVYSLLTAGTEFMFGVQYVGSASIANSEAAGMAIAVRSITRALTHCTDDNIADKYVYSKTVTGFIIAEAGYTIPEAIVITSGEATLVDGDDYDYYNTVGNYEIFGSADINNLTITAVAIEGVG